MGKVLSIKPRTASAVLTVAPAIEQFLDRDWSPHTEKNFRSDLQRFAKQFGRRRVDRILPRDIQDYLNSMKTVQGRSVSTQTYNRHCGTLKNLFGWLERQEELERSPMTKVERKKVGERLPRPMTQKQVKAFFARIDPVRDWTLFSLLYGSGLRVGEALALDIEELDLDKGTFRVVGKGDRERIGYLSEETAKLVKRYLRERGRPRSGPLFESRNGTRLSYSMAWKLFRKYADGVNASGTSLTIHQLRHTFGSERACEIDALILRDLMGHKSLRTTQQYAKVNPEAARKAFRSFDRQRSRR